MNTTESTTDSALGHEQWMGLAKTEYERVDELIGSLAEGDWSHPTDCPGWDVKAMVAHMVGAAESSASLLEAVRQLRMARKWAKQHDCMLVDGLSAVQIDAQVRRSTSDIATRYHEIWPRALRRRERMPAPLRKYIKVPGEVPGVNEEWTFGYLNDCIYTRDSWMHRIDLSRAIGRNLQTTPDHDGLIVRDLVSEWAARHGQPYSLQLTGLAGGHYSSASGAPTIELDAIDFARIVSRRAAGTGLLSTAVPFSAG